MLRFPVTWEALEHAHIPANQLRGLPVGVFMGSTNNDYAMLISADPAEAHPYALTGNSTAVIANRISYAYDFRGPSVAVDTACSSSLVAIHQAVRSLRDGDSTVAIAGGAAGFALRRWELATAFEADTGLPIDGAPATLALIALSVVMAAW